MKLFGSLVLILPLFLNEVFAGNIFFTDRGTNEVMIAGLDGSNPRTLIPAAGTNIRGIVIDVETEQLFYADNGGNIIYRTHLDGSSSIPIISTDLDFPADLVLDTREEKLYWCDRDNNRIERANYDGSEREVVIDTNQPYFLDLDLRNQKIYWGDYSGGNIFRADLLVGVSEETVVSGLVQVRGVIVDSWGGYFYWCDRNASKVQRRKIEGGEIEDLYTDLDTPHGLTLDLFAGKIYWVDTGTNDLGGSGANAVSRGDMDGSNVRETLLIANEPWDITLDLRSPTYNQWVARRFPKNAPSSISNPEADPDLDTHNNLTEYFGSLDPLRSQKQQPSGYFLVEGEFLFSYLETFDNLTDVEATVEITNDFITWNSGHSFTEQFITGITEGAWIQVYKPLPAAVTPNGTFLRLRLEMISD